jgi:hypothetical protein
VEAHTPCSTLSLPAHRLELGLAVQSPHNQVSAEEGIGLDPEVDLDILGKRNVTHSCSAV